MLQNFSDVGISWKVYNSKLFGGFNDIFLSCNGYVGSFKQVVDLRLDLVCYGIVLVYLWDFICDVINNMLFQVFWVVLLIVEFEYLLFLVVVGVVMIVNLIRVLLCNLVVWEKIVLIIVYDEYGGFFDYVILFIVLEGIFCEWIFNSVDIDKVDGFGGICGFIGLGFCVFCFVILFYSCGGLMVYDWFDYILQL